MVKGGAKRIQLRLRLSHPNMQIVPSRIIFFVTALYRRIVSILFEHLLPLSHFALLPPPYRDLPINYLCS